MFPTLRFQVSSHIGFFFKNLLGIPVEKVKITMEEILIIL
jgi:hypothetical protein